MCEGKGGWRSGRGREERLGRWVRVGRKSREFGDGGGLIWVWEIWRCGGMRGLERVF